jgi:hypothetical protein
VPDHRPPARARVTVRAGDRLDDTDFGQLGWHGSPIATQNLDALANNMHTTSPAS